MPWKEITPVSERLGLCRMALEGKFSVSRLAGDFGVSRKTAYKWIERYREGGEIGVLDRSRRPERSPTAVGEELARAVLEMKSAYPMWGPRKLHKLLQDELGEQMPSRATVGRILERNGLTSRREPRPREEAVLRFERGKPNEMWQTDFAAPFPLPDGKKVWPVAVLDDHSRYCVSLIGAPDCSGKSALLAFRMAAERYGLPDEMLSDHGSAFGTSREHVSAFTAYLWALKVEHAQGRYAHPQTQGKLERLNRTMYHECISRHSYSTTEHWNKCFEEYRQTYNELRPHESLLDAVPASRYRASERGFEEPDRDYRPDGEDLVHRRVDVSGKIWLLQHHVKVGNGLAGWTVSARHEGGGIWTVFFHGRTVCQTALAKLAPYKPKP